MKIVQPFSVTDSGTFSRASTGTYFDSNGNMQVAAANVRRITFNPSDLSQSSYELIEGASQNILLNSDIEGSVGAIPTGGTEFLNPFRVSTERFLGPNGKSAKTVLQNSDTNLGYFSFNAVSGNTYTLSVWIYIPSGYSNISIAVGQEGGTTTTISSKNTSEAYFGKWQRIERVFTANSAGAVACVLRYNAPSVPSVQFGAFLYTDCWQVEVANTPTSYIPTTTSAQTRAADFSNSSLQSNITENDYVAYISTRVYPIGETVQVVGSNVHKIYKSLVGSTTTVSITIASPTVITWSGVMPAEGDPIVFTTTGTLPTGIVANTVYYVKAPTTSSTFNITATVGGTAINTSGTQSGVHTGTSSKNYGKDPATNPATWLDMGATNRWKMFDQSVQSQTTNAKSVSTTIKTTGYIDTVALLNVTGNSVTVTATHATSGVVYTKTKSLSSTVGIVDLYTYFFTPIKRVADVLFEGIPLYANLSITITVSNGNSIAGIGCCILGQAVDMSGVGAGLGTAAGAKLGLQDYSRKEVDEFGNYTIVKRAFSKKNDYTIFMGNDNLDYFYNLLVERRSTPTLYIGASKYTGLIVYGFYKDFSIDISYPEYSVCSITLESLT